MPVLSKLHGTKLSGGEKSFQNKNRTYHNPLSVNCCAFAKDEVLDLEINQCDSDKTKTIDRDKDLKEQVKTPALNSQVIDRMLLRTSTFQLPSLVTGASGNDLLLLHIVEMC